MSRFDVYQVNDTLCLSHCLSLSHTGICSPMHLPTFKLFTHPLILFLSLLLYFSLSLSLWCVHACVRACPFLLLSLTFALAFSLRLSIRLSFSSIHTHSCTRSHTLSLIQSLTNAHTHQIFIPIFLAHSHTFLSLSLSFSLSLSYTHTLIHTHTFALTHSFTYSLAHPLIHCCRVCSTHFSRNVLSIFCIKQIYDSTRPNPSGDRQETFALPKRAQERHSMMVRSGLHWCTLVRHNLRICRRILRRHNPTSTFLSRIRLLTQWHCYLLAREYY